MTEIETSLWDEAAQPVMEQKAASLVSLAQAAVEPLWPYLSAAATRDEFEHRMGMVEDGIASRVAAVVEDPMEGVKHAVVALQQRWLAADADRTVNRLRSSTAGAKVAGDGMTAEVMAFPQCDICQNRQAAYDGKTTQGPWAYMCESCFNDYGIGLGLGQGQRLVLAPSSKTGALEKGKEVTLLGKTYVSTGESATTLDDGNNPHSGTMFYLKSDPTVRRAITDADLAKTSALEDLDDGALKPWSKTSALTSELQPGDYVVYRGEEVQVDEVMADAAPPNVVIRFLDSNDTALVWAVDLKKGYTNADITTIPKPGQAGWETFMSGSLKTRTAAWIDEARTVVENKQYAYVNERGFPVTEKTPGAILLDATTANVLVQIYDALNEANRAKFDQMTVTKAVDTAWKLVNRSRSASLRSLAGLPGDTRLACDNCNGTLRGDRHHVECDSCGLGVDPSVRAQQEGTQFLIDSTGIARRVDQIGEGQWTANTHRHSAKAGDRCSVCGDGITEQEASALNEDIDFVEHGDRGHLIRVEAMRTFSAAGYLGKIPDTGDHVPAKPGVWDKICGAQAKGAIGDCVRPKNHQPPHQGAHGYAWTDEFTATSSLHTSMAPLFSEGDKVSTPGGPGTVAEVRANPERYIVDLDGGGRQGAWPSQLTRASRRTAVGTKKVRGGALEVGMSIGGHRIERITRNMIHVAPGAMPVTQISAHFEPSSDPSAPVVAVYGSSEWVEIDRTTASLHTASPSDVCPKCGSHMDDVWVDDGVLRARCDCGWAGMKKQTSLHTAPGGGPHAPYKVEQRDGKWVVVNDLGEVKGTHDTEEQARQQQKALYANVPGASEQAERKHESRLAFNYDDFVRRNWDHHGEQWKKEVDEVEVGKMDEDLRRAIRRHLSRQGSAVAALLAEADLDMRAPNEAEATRSAWATIYNEDPAKLARIPDDEVVKRFRSLMHGEIPAALIDTSTDRGEALRRRSRELVDGYLMMHPTSAKRQAAAEYGDESVPDDLAQAAAKYWFGDRGVVEHDAVFQSRTAPDGGSYRLKGTRIRGGGESALIYRNVPQSRYNDAPYIIEFYDGSGGGIVPNAEGGWDYVGMGGPSHFASRRLAYPGHVTGWHRDLAHDDDSAIVFAQENVGRRLRIEFDDGEMMWGHFEMVGGQPEWKGEHNDYTHPLDWAGLVDMVTVAEPDPVGQESLFGREPYNLTASRRAVAALVDEVSSEEERKRRHDAYWAEHPEEYDRHLRQNASRRTAGPAGPMDRSVIFTLLLEYMPGFGDMNTREGEVLITEATEAWQASDETNMLTFVKQWIENRRTGSRRRAVNEGAYGTERYQTLPAPVRPSWITQWADEETKATQQMTEEGMNAYVKPNPFPGLVTLQDVRTAALKVAGYDEDFEGAASGQAYTTKPAQVPGQSQRPATAPDMSMQQPLSDPQMGSGGGFDMGYANQMGVATDPMQPTPEQMVAAKVARLSERIRLDNPSMAEDEARRLAALTIAKHPEMVKGSR